MSFNICLNSVDGTKVAGNLNQVIYNFAFPNTPAHDGGYKVTMAFASNLYSTAAFNYVFKDIYVNANLGAFDNFTPIGSYTGTQNNQVLGVVRVKEGGELIVIQANPASLTGTASVPVNSGTAAYTLTTNTSSNVGTYDYSPRYQSIGAYYFENPPVYLRTKPTLNQFIITLANLDGTLNIQGGDYFTNYSLLINFEAV